LIQILRTHSVRFRLILYFLGLEFLEPSQILDTPPPQRRNRRQVCPIGMKHVVTWNKFRTVTESNQQVQSQRDYLPSLDLSITTIQHVPVHYQYIYSMLQHVSFLLGKLEEQQLIGWESK
jgi:hypothetical protein